MEVKHCAGHSRLGAAVPITWVGGEVETGLLLYLSYELPFRKQ